MRLRLSHLASNLVANLGASLATALIALFLIPLYIRILGLETYGLIGFYLALRGFLQVLDFGMGPVVNREVARYLLRSEDAPEARDALHTFQGLYWIVGAAVGGLVFAMAPLIAGSWLKSQALSHDEVTTVVRLIGLLIAVQWPATFYQSALLGMERQVVLSAILTAASIFTHVGALVLMTTVAQQVEVFFFCAIAVSAVQVLVMALLFSRWIRFRQKAVFRLRALKHVARFALSVGAITIGGTALAQVDKLLLSFVLPLERFAYYSLAAVMAGALAMVMAPIFNTFYPRFSSLVAAGREGELRELYHFGSQVVTLAVIPAMLMVVFFGHDLVEIWTRSIPTAAEVAPLAALLAAGAALNGLMTLPYALQLAHGWTRLGVIFTTSATLLYLPLLAFIAARSGAMGAAAAWVMLNAVYFLTVAPATHSHLMKGSLTEWLTRDIAFPAFVAAVITAACAALLPDAVSLSGRFAAIVATYALVVGGTLVSAGRLRGWLFGARLRDRRPRGAPGEP